MSERLRDGGDSPNHTGKVGSGSILNRCDELLTVRNVGRAMRPLIASARVLGSMRHRPKQKRPNVAVFMMDGLGDLFLRSIFLTSLKASVPDVSITAVARPGLVELVRNCDLISDVIAFDPPASGLAARMVAFCRLFAATACAKPFDVAVIPRSGDDTYFAHWGALFTGAPDRFVSGLTLTLGATGWDAPVVDPIGKEGRRGVDMHESEVMREYAAIVSRHLGHTPIPGPPRIWHNPSDIAWARDTAAEIRQRGLRLAVFGTGAGAPCKLWPMSHFGELSQHLAGQGWICWFLGSPEDRHRMEAVVPASSPAAILTAEALDLGKSIALAGEADLFVGNDTGITHAAAIQGAPTLCVTGFPKDGDPASPFSPHRFGLIGPRVAVLQPPTLAPGISKFASDLEARTIGSLSVSQVAEVLSALLGAIPTPALPGADRKPDSNHV